MRHSLYASERNAKTARIIGQAFNLSRSGNYQRPDHKDQRSGALGADRKDKVLETRLTLLMRKYKDDPETIEEIRSTVSMFVINRSIARQCKNNTTEKDLTRKFIEYLNTLEKRKKL